MVFCKKTNKLDLEIMPDPQEVAKIVERSYVSSIQYYPLVILCNQYNVTIQKLTLGQRAHVALAILSLVTTIKTQHFPITTKISLVCSYPLFHVCLYMNGSACRRSYTEMITDRFTKIAFLFSLNDFFLFPFLFSSHFGKCHHTEWTWSETERRNPFPN